MSYTPENEDLEGPVFHIIGGIKMFKNAASNRKSGDSGWNDNHLAELTKIENMLNDVELALRVLTR